jgi:hypothetical protein
VVHIKKPFSLTLEKGLSVLATTMAIIIVVFSPYPPHWMSLKGCPILFVTLPSVKRENNKKRKYLH